MVCSSPWSETCQTNTSRSRVGIEGGLAPSIIRLNMQPFVYKNMHSLMYQTQVWIKILKYDLYKRYVNNNCGHKIQYSKQHPQPGI